MQVSELPLIELFARLRQAGLPLGMNEYQLMLQALRSGFGLPDEAAIARLCRTLWVKSEEDRVLFDYHFEQVMIAEREKLAAEREKLAAEQAELAAKKDKLAATHRRGRLLMNWRSRRRNAIMGLLAVVVGTAATGFWLVRPKCPYITSRPPGWVGFISLVEAEEDYVYNITACQGAPDSVPQFEVLLKPPQLREFTDNQNGTATLKGNFGEKSTKYSRIDQWTMQGEPISTFAHYEDTHSLQYSPDGQHFITQTLDKNTLLWTLDGTIVDLEGAIGPEELPDGNGKQVQFSSDGQLFVVPVKGNQAHVYNLDGDLITNFGGKDIRSVYINPGAGEQTLILLSEDSGIPQLFDFQGNQLLDFNLEDIIEVEFSPEGQHLLMRSSQNTAELVNLAGQRMNKFKDVQTIQFSPNNRHIATLSEEGVIQIWERGDVDDVLRIEPIKAEGDSQAAVEFHFSESGNEIVAISSGPETEVRTARLWTVEGNLLTDFDQQTVKDVAFSANRLMLNFEDGTAQLWNLQGNQLYDFGASKNIFSFDASPDSRYVVTRAEDNAASLWNLRAESSLFANDLISTPLKDIQDTEKVVFSPDSQDFITLSPTYQIELAVSGSTGGEDNSENTDIQSFRVVSLVDLAVFSELAGIFAAVVFLIYLSLPLLLPTGYVIIRKLTHARVKPTEFPPVEDLPLDDPTATSELNQSLEDELQVAQAIQQQGRREGTDLPVQAFTESNEYFPITRRQMKQSWRHLRRLVREGPATELDVAATIAQAGREGILLQPVFRPRRVNRNQLLLLIDQDGSMVPFHALSERLAQAAIDGGRLASAGTYYFHNCPNGYLYDDPHHQIAQLMSTVLEQVRSDRTSVVIFSDAGAARGAFNGQRLALTLQFLDQLQGYLHQVVWLNPMPQGRWSGTASEIAKRVPMFELSRQGLNQAIDVLRGKPFYL